MENDIKFSPCNIILTTYIFFFYYSHYCYFHSISAKDFNNNNNNNTHIYIYICTYVLRVFVRYIPSKKFVHKRRFHQQVSEPSPLLLHILLYIILYHPHAGLPIYTLVYLKTFFPLLKYYIPTGQSVIYYIITDMEYFQKKNSIQTYKHPAQTTFFLLYTMRIRYFCIFFYVHIFIQLPRISTYILTNIQYYYNAMKILSIIRLCKPNARSIFHNN